MTFEQFYKSAIKRWYIVVICFVCLGAGAYVGSSVLLHPVYESTAVMQVVVRNGGNPLSSDNITASVTYAETAADLATTRQVLTAAAAKNPGMTADDLNGAVKATARSNKPLLDIAVDDSDPNQAAKLANDVAQALISQQQSQMGVQTATEGQFLIQVQQAQPSDTPIRPNKTINAAGGLAVGLILGLLLAVIIELSNTKIRTKDELVELVGWPVLGTVWQTEGRENVINLTGPNSNSDAYSILHTNIGFASVDKPAHTLVVTSGQPGDGKTVVAANLAISMAKAGKSTLLVDANLRHPTLHEIFNIPAHTKGFTNAIVAFRTKTTNQQGLMPFVQAVNIPNLSVMPSGPLPPVPSELLGSNAMQSLLHGLSTSGFEMVVFDTPALLGLSDAAVLASKVDGAVVVVSMDNAKKGDLKQAKELLQRAGARVLGFVINRQQGERTLPYKHVSYSYDTSFAAQAGEYANHNQPVPAPSSPPPAAPTTPVNWSSPKPQISSHGIPPQPSQFSAPGASQKKDR